MQQTRARPKDQIPQAQSSEGDPRQERRRLAALFAMDVLNSPREPLLERILRLAQAEFRMDAAAVVLIDHASAIFHQRVGTGVESCPRTAMPCNRVVASGQPLLLQDARGQAELAAGAPQIRSYAGFPLLTPEGLAIGTLALFSDQPDQVPEDRLELGRTFAAMVMDTLALRRVAAHDPLTGALNRRGFMEKFEEDLRARTPDAPPLTFVMMEVDQVRALDDQHGPGSGDQALRQVARQLQLQLGGHHPLGRVGGEEFAVVLKGLDTDAAYALMERVRSGLAEIETPETSGLLVSSSFGLAELGVHGRNSAELLARSDDALGRAKREGNNPIRVAPPLEP